MPGVKHLDVYQQNQRMFSVLLYIEHTLQRGVQIVTLATLEYLEIGSLQMKLYSILELGGPLIK